MKLTTTKISFIIIITTVMLILASAFSYSASFKFVMENRGKTWKLSNSNYLGSVGFKDLTASATFTLAEIITNIDQGTPVKFYAGPGLTSLTEYTELTSSTVFDYTAIPGQQSIDDAFYIEFEPRKVRFEHFGFKGHKTLHANGKLGFLENVPAPVPGPATWWLAAMGMLLILWARHRFST